MQDVDISFLIPNLKCANLFVWNQLFVKLVLGESLYYHSSLYYVIQLVLLALIGFGYGLVLYLFLTIEFLLYLAADIDHLAIFDHLLW